MTPPPPLPRTLERRKQSFRKRLTDSCYDGASSRSLNVSEESWSDFHDTFNGSAEFQCEVGEESSNLESHTMINFILRHTRSRRGISRHHSHTCTALTATRRKCFANKSERSYASSPGSLDKEPWAFCRQNRKHRGNLKFNSITHQA